MCAFSLLGHCHCGLWFCWQRWWRCRWRQGGLRSLGGSSLCADEKISTAQRDTTKKLPKIHQGQEKTYRKCKQTQNTQRYQIQNTQRWQMKYQHRKTPLLTDRKKSSMTCFPVGLLPEVRQWSAPWWCSKRQTFPNPRPLSKPSRS